MRYFFLTTLILLSFSVCAQQSKLSQISAQPQSAGQSVAPSTQGGPTQDTPEERAYKQQMIKLSNQISNKITEIQNKQREIDTEIYPAYVPPLQGDMMRLQEQLKILEMQKNQLESQKTAKDLQRQLQN